LYKEIQSVGKGRYLHQQLNQQTMKKLIILAAASFTAVYANAQQVVLSSEVISPAGGYYELTNNDITISTTVGELIITTEGSGDIILTQGFQQPEMPNDPTLIQNVEANGVSMSVYPNPFTDEFTAVVVLEKNDKLTFLLTDATGRIVSFEKVMPQAAGQAVYTFNTNGLATGMYSLTLRNESGSFTKTMKLSKVN